jgi:hypothetical protein
VLLELGVTLAVSLVTQSPRIAALREPLYLAVGGGFCLLTLAYGAPLSHRSAASVASFGDARRVAAFAYAWGHVPRYRAHQRLLTATIGAILVVAAALKAAIVLSAAARGIGHAVDVSNMVTIAMIGVLVLASGVLIQRPKRIIEDLLERGATPVHPSEEAHQ